MTTAKTISSLTAVALLGTLALTGASAQQSPPGYERGQGASNRNLRRVERELDREIDAMRRDDRDYDGHRTRAIADLEAARNEINAAEAYARTHGY